MLVHLDEVAILKDIFVSCLESYVHIMADWITKGELNDACEEFFIKQNPKIYANSVTTMKGASMIENSSKVLSSKA